MRTVTYKLDDLKKVAISIGRADENEATRVQIDAGQLFAEYPAAVPAMKVISPAGVTYSREVTRDGDLVVWDVVDSDLAAEGYGEMQLTFTENSVKVKSAIAQIRVCRSIVGEGTAPDPVQDWLDEAEDVLEDVEEALGAFPTGGTTGQVLAKKSNDDYDTEWVNQGSGGTTDYTELENKPQIGGVTLTGDKSLHDLGAAAESDIPDVSGFYTKPVGGIPASDIEAGVIPDPAALIDDTSTAANKVWSASKANELKSAISSVEDELVTGQAQTYTGVICTLEGQNAGDTISITPNASVNKIYHTKKNLFKLFNRTAGTLTGWGASSVRPFKDNEYYNGFISNGTYDGSVAGTLEYITDGIQTKWGSNGGGGGKGTVFPVLLPAGKYTISVTARGQFSILMYDADAVFTGRWSNSNYGTWGTETSVSVTFEVTGGTRWVGILFYNLSSTSANNPSTFKNVMLVEGESSATYEVYEGEVITESTSSLTAYAGVNKIFTDAGSFDIDTTVHRLTVIEDDVDALQEKTEVLDNDVIHRNLDQLPEVHACVSYGVHSGGTANNKRTIGILLTTDVHGREQVMQNAITYLNEYSFLDIGVCLGDITGSYYNDSDGTWYTDIVNQSTKPFYTILGNHDLGNGTDSTNDKCVTVDKAFEKWIEPTLETMGKTTLTVPYYAVHNATYGISMIFLNSYDVPDTKSGDAFVVSRGVNGYSQTQIDWFISELNNVPATNHLILFQHCNVCDATKDEGAWTQKWNNLPNTGSYGDLIPDIINAWITGGTLSETYTTAVTGLSSITVSADFTSRGVGVFVGHVFGHYHRDIMAHSTKYSGQKLVSLMCTADGLWQNGENDLPRVENTKTQDAITILSVNKTRKTLNLVRVGSTKTLSMTERNMIAIPY